MTDRARTLYTDLGAVPVINALGPRTMLGGSSPSPTVLAEMELAGRYYVDMDQLLAGSGRVVADMLGCEAALVTPGCAAALLMGTVACVAGADPEAMGRLPDTTGLPSQVIIQAPQRYKYDRVIRMAGVQLVEAGTARGCTRADVEAVLTHDTAAVLYPVLGGEPRGILSLEEMVDVAHAAGVPVIADAAYQIYPLDNFRRTASAADLVGFGGKYFGGPNSSGLLCGRRDLVEAALAHSFAAFERREVPGYGRPLKIDRQEVIGVLAALREWLDETIHVQREADASRRGRRLRDLLTGLPGVQMSPSDGDRVTTLRLTLSAAATLSAAELATRLQAGNPSIWSDSGADAGEPGAAVTFHLQLVEDGDVEVIGARVRELLARV